MDQAEQLRNVIKLHNQNNQNNARVVTITSGKGGVGKSNLAVNLAVCLRKAGKRVIIFDADFGLANVEVMFGAIPQYNLSDFIYRGKSIREIITPGPMDIGFISGGSGIIGLNNLTKEQILYIVNSIDTLNELADFILMIRGQELRIRFWNLSWQVRRYYWYHHGTKFPDGCVFAFKSIVPQSRFCGGRDNHPHSNQPGKFPGRGTGNL